MNNQCYYFWGSELSQWFPCKFEVAGIWYNCAEQYMMAGKAMCFNDEQTEAAIMKVSNPREHKKLGRQVKNFNPEVWNACARDIVYWGNFAKFTQNDRFLNYLLMTKDKTLVEASPYDKIWGVGRSQEELEAGADWNGTNWLGEVLMQVRNDIFDGIYRKSPEEFDWSE